MKMTFTWILPSSISVEMISQTCILDQGRKSCPPSACSVVFSAMSCKVMVMKCKFMVQVYEAYNKRWNVFLCA